MSEPDEAAVKRWTVEEWHEFPEWGEILTWPSDPPLRALVAEVDDEDDAGAIAAYAALVQAIRDAETLAKVREIVADNPRQPAYAGGLIARLLAGES